MKDVNLWRESVMSFDFNNAVSEYARCVAENDTGMAIIVGKNITKMIERRVIVARKDATHDGAQ